MPKIAYEPCVMKSATLAIATTAEQICQDYADEGYELTLRQLYYQFVARDLFPDDRRFRNVGGNKWVRDPNGTKNAQPNYEWLGVILSNARLCGIVDWNHIEDRTRAAYRNSGSEESVEDAIEITARAYRRDHWEDQPNYVEVWIEKEALAGVVQRPADELEITYFSCRGYVSQSEMWRAGRRLASHAAMGRTPYVFHLGDHDPSGIDMSRDIQDRLATFMTGNRHDLVFERIALNMDQVRQFNPPPNPAKIGDSRYEEYRSNYGDESWELDALQPQVLSNLITSHVRPLIDQDLWDRSINRETREQELLQQVSDRWGDVEAFLTG